MSYFGIVANPAVEFVSNLFTRGGWVMYPLAGCSVVAATVIIERLLFWCRESVRRNQRTVDEIFSATERGSFVEAMAAIDRKPDMYARILLSGLTHRDYGLAENMEVAANDEIKRMRQRLSVLDTIITLAPLLGILGTVTGIIASFDILGLGEMGDPQAVIGGISEALITTATGLAIALIVLIPYNYFVAKIEQVTRELGQIATQFEVAYRRGLGNATDKRV
jgi:biopolymer transport protein ExbB